MEAVDPNATIPIHFRGLNEMPSVSELAKETEEALIREEQQKRIARKREADLAAKEERKRKREKGDGSGTKKKKKKAKKTAASEVGEDPVLDEVPEGATPAAKSPQPEAFECKDSTPKRREGKEKMDPADEEPEVKILATPSRISLVSHLGVAEPAPPKKAKKIKKDRTAEPSASPRVPPPARGVKGRDRRGVGASEGKHYGIPDVDMMTAAPQEAEAEVPDGIQRYAGSVFRRFCPGYIRQEIDNLPFEMVMSHFCQDTLEIGAAASLLWEKSECYEAMKKGEMPPELAAQVAEAKKKEEAAKQAIIDERNSLLTEKTEWSVDLAAKQNEVDELTSKLAEAALREKRLEAAAAKAEKDMADLREVIRKADERIDSLISNDVRQLRGFLSSKSFQVAARLAVGPSALNALHAALLRVKLNFPCDPSEFHLPLAATSPPDLSKCHWDQDRDRLLDDNGEEMTELALFPEFEKIELKYKWEGPRPDIQIPEVSVEESLVSASTEEESESEEEEDVDVETVTPKDDEGGDVEPPKEVGEEPKGNEDDNV